DLVVQRFTRAFAALTPEQFVEEFVRRHLELVHVVVGYNVRFGRNRAGTVDTLRALGARLGFGVDVVGPVEADGQHVSSSLVRQVVQAGDVRQARRLLGRRYALRGRVVAGDRRGRTLGFSTADPHTRPRILLAPDGVSVVSAALGRGAGT